MVDAEVPSKSGLGREGATSARCGVLNATIGEFKERQGRRAERGVSRGDEAEQTAATAAWGDCSGVKGTRGACGRRGCAQSRGGRG